jgi:glycosyltransferase involved in cell wall biosynthesis
MKILQVFPHSYQKKMKGGGILEYVRNISERLARRHDVTVFATNSGSDFLRREVINGVKVQRFERFAPGKAYFLSLSMLMTLRKSEFDVVHGHCYQAFPMHFSALAKHRRLIVSTHFHGVGHSSFRNALIRTFRLVGKRTLRTADKIIAVSEFEKSLLLSQFRLGEEKVLVVPCGVDLKELSGLKKQKSTFRSVLYVGRLQDYKGVQYLVEVMPRLANDVQLDIVGKGVLRPLLEKRAAELGMLDRIRFYQDLSRRQLLQMYADADVFALPSRYEAYSMAVAEALAAGTPCVVANSSALTEWIDGETCLGVDLPIKLDVLAEQIMSVIEHGKSIGSSIRQNPKIRDWDYVVRQLEGIYEE